MSRLHRALAIGLALGLSAACTQPQRDDIEEAADDVANDVAQGTNQLVMEAREAFNELGTEFQELETKNANLQGESAGAWAQTRQEIVQAQQELQSDLARLESATQDEAEQVRSRVAENLETMTHRVERADLLATEGNQEFVAAAQERLVAIDQDIQSLETETARLPMEARNAVSQAVDNLRSEANDVRETVMSFADAAPQEIAEQREELAEDVATLSATVRREQFELQAELEN